MKSRKFWSGWGGGCPLIGQCLHLSCKQGKSLSRKETDETFYVLRISPQMFKNIKIVYPQFDNRLSEKEVRNRTVSVHAIIH